MQEKILIVDDLELNRELLTDILEDDYEICTAASGQEALDILAGQKDFSIILLDLVMPGINGYQVLEYLYREQITKLIPVIIISGETEQAEMHCLDFDAYDFIHKPFNVRIIQKRIRNAINLYQYKNDLEAKVAKQTEELRAKNRQLQENVHNLIDVLAATVEARDMDTGGHITRIKEYSRILAETLQQNYPEYGLTDKGIECIYEASALHDIGKIKVSDTILLKPGKLTNEEFEIMKQHPVLGCELLDNIHGIWSEDDDTYEKVAYDICRHHHERYDGRGYPDHLAGDDISIEAQIVSLADVYDALTHDRPYKVAFSEDRAYEMICDGQCGCFNPKILDCFGKCRDKMKK